jgi:hypothetical protein
MPAAVRNVMASAALAAAGAAAVIPVTARLADTPLASPPTRLTAAGDSLLNVPMNLFYDIVNIPYNEVQAVNTLAGSEFLTGTWFVPDSTNLWGVDPGDPSHVAGLLSFVLPIPALRDPFIYQLDGFLAAELPVSAGCDAEGCAPLVPTSPITDITSLDQSIWTAEILTGQEKFPLFEGWFQVPLSDLTSGYTFGNVVNPAGSAIGGYGFENGTAPDGTPNPFDGGTIPGPDGTDLMPYSNMTFTLNPLQPFENFFNSLMAPPPTDGILGSGIELPNLQDIAYAVQSFAAGTIIDFDPFVPGSPLCFGTCASAIPVPTFVQDISNLNPGNPLITEWLTDYANGVANEPTAEQVQNTINILQQGGWDGGNPEPPADWSVGFDPAQLAPMFTKFWESLGLNPSATPGGLAALLGEATYDPSNSSGDVLLGGDSIGQALEPMMNAPALAGSDLLGGLIP